MNQNEEKINLKIYIIIVLLLGIVVITFTVKSIVDYQSTTKNLESLKSLNKDLQEIVSANNYEEIKLLNQRYLKYIDKINPSEGISSYTNFITDKQSELNFRIENTKVLNSNDKYYEIENNIFGDSVSIYNLINSIENESPAREIQKAEIKFQNNKIDLDLVVRTYKVK